MLIRNERQLGPVGAEIEALVAVVRPIVASVARSIGEEYVEAYDSDRGAIPLKMLGRLRKRGDGDCGIAFEYAVHDAIREANGEITQRISDALRLCRIRQGDPRSIFFAIEKQGSQHLIDTDFALITNESRVLSGKQGQPVKLKKQLSTLASAFRRENTRLNLPQSIRGLWKADLFLGSTVPDHWVGTTVKINPSRLEAAPGLRVAIVPTATLKSDRVRLVEEKNIVLCPVPHDASFMQLFYEAWQIVQVLCETDFKDPRPIDLPNPTHLQCAKVFIERRDYAVGEVLAATAKFAQPHLLDTSEESASVSFYRTEEGPHTGTIVNPLPLQVGTE